MSDLYTTRNESEYRLVSIDGDPQDAGFRITRQLENIHAAYADSLATQLNAIRVFSNPKVDKQTYSGIFIQSNLTPKAGTKDDVDLIQILTKVRTTRIDSEATLIKIDGDPQKAGFRIQRAWKYIAPASVDTLFTAIRSVDTYGSPKADRQTYSGKFIQTTIDPVKEDDKSISLVQVLTKVKTATDSADADLVNITGDPKAAGTSISREWKYIDPNTADTLYAALNSIRSYASAIKVDKQVFSGKFIVGRVQNLPSEDRSVTIRQDLVKVATTTDSSAAVLLGTEGDPQWAGFKVFRGWRYIDPAAADGLVVTLNGITSYSSGVKADSQLYGDTFINTIVTSGTEADGSVLIKQTLTKVKSAIDSADADLLELRGNPANAGSQLTRGWHYLDPVDADSLYTTLNAITSYATGVKADGQLYSGKFIVSGVQPEVTEDKSITIKQIVTKVKTTTDSADADLLEVKGDPNSVGTQITRAWRYIDPDASDGLYTTLNAIKSYASGIKADGQLYSGKFYVSTVAPQIADDKSSTINQICVKVATATDSATAILVGVSGDPQRSGFQIKRVWKHIDPDAVASLSSSLNAVSVYTSGVKADGVLYSDTYVNSGVGTDQEQDRTQTISQTLTKVKSATDSSDADLLAIEGTPANGGLMVRRAWHYIDPSDADTLFTTLNGRKTYATGIKADGQLYSGKFAVSTLKPAVADDKSITIEQICRKLVTATDSASARLSEIRGDPQWAGFQVKRHWPYIDPAATDGLMVTLAGVKTYSSGIKADSQIYSDTFISSEITSKLEDDQSDTIFQLCTKVKSALDSSDADMLSIEGDPKVAGSTIRRAWHYINPNKVDTLFQTLNAVKTYASGIKADGQLYSGYYSVSRVLPEVTEDKTVRISQFCKKVINVTSDSNLSNPIVGREKEIIHPFGEGRGTQFSIIFKYPNLAPVSDTKLMAFSDTTLEVRMDAAKTYDLIDRKTQLEDDRTLSFYLLARKVSRTNWTTTLYQTPQRKMYENKGRGHEQRSLFWYGINRNHHDSVVGDLVDASSDTGFRTVSVTWHDDDIGAKDYVWTQIKSTVDTRTDSSIENTHGKEHLAVLNKHTDYSDYSSSTLPSDPALSAGYKSYSKQVKMNNRGLFDKVVVSQKRVSSNIVTTGQPARKIIQARSNPKGQTDVDSAGQEQVILYDRINSTAGDTVVATVGVNDTKFSCAQASFADYGDGSGKVTKYRIRVNKAAKYYWNSDQASVGSYSATVMRTWPRVWDTKAIALIDSSGDARSDSKYQGSTYSHLHVIRRPNGDGTSDVVQTLTIPTNPSSAGSSGTDSNYSMKYGVRTAPALGAGPKAVKIFTYFKEQSSKTNAVSWSDSSNTYKDLAGLALKEGAWYGIGNGKYKAFKVKYAAL